MKVILLKDVKALGKKDQVVEVNNGYANNCLIPKGLGMEATGKNLNDLKLKKKNEKKLAAEELQEAKDLKAEIEKSEVTLHLKAGTGGRTFGSVSTKEIAEGAKAQLNLTIDKKKIVVKDPIKSLGVTNVTVKLHPEVTATLKVHVVEA